VNGTPVDALAAMLLYGFVLCCVVSAALQIVAWSRHGRADVPVSLRALWKPDDYFDEIGRRQIRIARRLLNTGIVLYLCFGLLNLVARG
jgi:hypothetical protein